MKKFRKKPVAVEAMQWTGNNTGIVMEWAGERRNPDTGELELTFVPLAYLRPKLWVAANSAWVEVEPDEWFIRDARGVYPCKPDIFEATYEPADTPARDEAAELRAALEMLLNACHRGGVNAGLTIEAVERAEALIAPSLTREQRVELARAAWREGLKHRLAASEEQP